MDTKERMIKASDRCDSCSQKAIYMATFIAGSLFFCGHHFRKNEEAIITAAIDVYDESDEEKSIDPSEDVSDIQ